MSYDAVQRIAFARICALEIGILKALAHAIMANCRGLLPLCTLLPRDFGAENWQTTPELFEQQITWAWPGGAVA